jgi:hypothetical protein
MLLDHIYLYQEPTAAKTDLSCDADPITDAAVGNAVNTDFRVFRTPQNLWDFEVKPCDDRVRGNLPPKPPE